MFPGDILMDSSDILKKIQQLPTEMQKELADFIDSLIAKSKMKNQHKLRLDWAGGLSEYKDQFTSLELQHKVVQWWEEK